MKKLILAAFVLSQTLVVFAQKAAPENWFNLDLKKDKVPGVSTERAYNELLKDKKSTPVIVAVIDGGTEVDHEDLAPVIWVNQGEIPNNNIDDDKNGYIDDVNGWNFIGGKTEDVNDDNLELTRVYKQLSEKYNGSTAKTGAEYDEYLKVKADFEKRKKRSQSNLALYTELIKSVDGVIKSIGTENPTADQLKAFTPANPMEKQVVTIATKNKIPLGAIKTQLNGAIGHFSSELNVHLNEDLDSRKLVGDNYNDVTEKYYGNNHYEGPSGDHGTHVAGIIAGVRNNNKGMKGVADNVKIMVVRVVPNGDERDKDIANGIRYAVDNGAKVINMSFGKSYSPNKTAVDEAVKYAVSKDVLLVHAAGNDGRNTDTTNNFPRDTYANNSGTASTWMEIGASSWKKGKTVTANFSNYGVQNVDVFAPGVDIYSTTPDSKYASFNGTSMAAPVTAGVAALLRSYYPTLTATQVKEILMQSAVKVKGKVFLPGTAKRKVKMAELCQTGAIINAYEAVKMADKMVSSK
ncbi:MAG: S8 family peptidase [Bacteroidota bacterium]